MCLKVAGQREKEKFCAFEQSWFELAEASSREAQIYTCCAHQRYGLQSGFAADLTGPPDCMATMHTNMAYSFSDE